MFIYIYKSYNMHTIYYIYNNTNIKLFFSMLASLMKDLVHFGQEYVVAGKK